MHVNSAAQPSTSSDGPSVRIPVDVRRFPWIRRLAADYAYDFRAVAPFFSGDPADRAAWADAIARSQAHTRRRDEIAAVIAAQQAQRQAPPRAREAGRSLADPRTVAVVTGQQAGLFGGPLFTLFKALTAIKLADKVSRDHRVPAAAIFWIDAEDHDWEEVRSCTVLDETLTPRTVSLPEGYETVSSSGRVDLLRSTRPEQPSRKHGKSSSRRMAHLSDPTAIFSGQPPLPERQS